MWTFTTIKSWAPPHTKEINKTSKDMMHNGDNGYMGIHYG